MTLSTRPSRLPARVIGTVLTALPLLLLLQAGCGTAAVPPPAGAEKCGGRTCAGSGDCQVNVPVCAVSSTAACLANPPRECVWKINTANSLCRCIEHDVRLCTASGGVPGVQICTAKPDKSGTDWAACVPCPSCTAG